MKKAKFMSFVSSTLFIGILFAAAFFIEPAASGTAVCLSESCGCSMVNPRIGHNIGNPFPRVSNEPKFIALTFDDGPSEHTLQLLDALGERGALATFFTVGEAINAYPHIAYRIVREGHEMACHSYSHPFLTTLTADEIRTELKKSRDAIYNASGSFPTVFRPPYGLHDPLVRSVAAEFGMPLILWSVDTIDWRDRDVDAILSHIINPHGFPLVQNGDIILMHDTLSTTVDGAIKIVDELLGLGFRFVTVSQLFDRAGIHLIPGTVYGCAR